MSQVANGSTPLDPTKAENLSAIGYYDYYENCRAALEEESCPGRQALREQGIDPDTALHAGLGFDADWKGVGEEHGHPSIIIPLRPTKYQTYLLEDTTKPWRSGARGLAAFNLGGMYEPGAHFITSGVFDALAIRECGYDASAMLGSNGTQRFIHALRNRDWKPPKDAVYILAMGQFPKEQESAQNIKEALAQAGAKAIITDLRADYKRVNEAYRDAPELFAARVEGAVKEAADLVAADDPEAAERILRKSDSLPVPRLDLPPKRPGKQYGTKVRRDLQQQVLINMQNASEDVRAAFEKVGISFDTALAAGLGYDPERGGDAFQDGALPIVIPMRGEQGIIISWDTKPRILNAKEAPVWRSTSLQHPGVVYITRDVPDALVALDCGQEAVALHAGAKSLIEWLEKRNWSPAAAGTVFVIALGGSEQDAADADMILQAFKAHRRTATKAAIRGNSATLLEEYQNNPDIVRKRFAVATKKCETALHARAAKLAAAKTARAARGKGKGRKGGGRKKFGKRPGNSAAGKPRAPRS